MKLAVILLTIATILGLIIGIILIISGKIEFAGIVWSITLILSCIARRIEIHRKNNK